MTDRPMADGPVTDGPVTDGPAAGPLIAVRDLDMRFPIPGGRFVQACSKVTFDVQPGETLGLVGESGSGKTTVGRCVLRLLDPVGGEIRYRGRRIDDLAPGRFRSYRSRMRIVFQEAYDSLDPRVTVEKMLLESLNMAGSGDRRAHSRRAAELVDQVGLGKRALRARPGELSAGDQQRAAIARALASDPEFVVLDEPTSNLPPDAEVEIIELLQELQSRLHLSYLFISHDLSLVQHFCHRVAVMYLSQIVEIGPRQQVFAHPAHPYSRALLGSVLRLDPEHRRREHPPEFQLSGEIPSPVDLPTACYLAGRCPIAVERCHAERQELMPVSPGHEVRCWKGKDTQ
jgi:oligopeptide/dipeptide ABC transporter ATP-binding protein